MPKTLKSSAREILLKVRAFCEKEKAKKRTIIPLKNVRSRVAAMTGVSEKTVSRITKEGEVAASRSTSQKVLKICTPGKKRNRKKIVELDDFELSAVRNKIHEFYIERKEVPTLNKLLVELRNNIKFKGGRTTLSKIIRQIGFRFKKCGSKQKILMEKYDIVAWRRNYINTLRQNRLEGQPIVFLHETSINASNLVKDDKDAFLTNHSPGTRWIILNAGGEMGFIPKAQLFFKTQSKSGNYHDDIYQINFMKWLTEILIPNLPGKSLIVMDNTSFHTGKINKSPTINSTKAQMQDWIKSKGLPCSDTLLKSELYQIIKKHKEPPVYEADQLLTTHGHKVVRLPPYHCELNASEMIWSLLKTRVPNNKVDQESKNIVKLTEEAFQSITPLDWEKQCQQVRNIEDKFYQQDACIDMEMEKFNIDLGNESDMESDSTDVSLESCH